VVSPRRLAGGTLFSIRVCHRKFPSQARGASGNEPARTVQLSLFVANLPERGGPSDPGATADPRRIGLRLFRDWLWKMDAELAATGPELGRC